MGWYGYESTGQEESRTPICRVVVDLFDTRPVGLQSASEWARNAEVFPILGRIEKH